MRMTMTKIRQYLKSYPQRQMHILRKLSHSLKFWMRSYPRMTTWKRFWTFIRRILFLPETMLALILGFALLLAGWIDRRFGR